MLSLLKVSTYSILLLQTNQLVFLFFFHLFFFRDLYSLHYQLVLWKQSLNSINFILFYLNSTEILCGCDIMLSRNLSLIYNV